MCIRDSFKPTFPKWSKKNLAEFVPTLDADGVDLLEQMLVYDPSGRISAKRALVHPYFQEEDGDNYDSFPRSVNMG